jgi:hypothetical protein
MNPEEIQRELDSLPADQQRALADRIYKQAADKERAERSARAVEKSAARARGRLDTGAMVFFRSPAFRWSLASLLLFIAAEGALFHIGWYNQYLEPNSTAGQVEGHLSWLKRYPHATTPEVMVIGDSRIAEGFSARGAGQDTSLAFRFWNFGVGGSTPRTWYYMLRDGDPTRRRFAAIVITLDRYTDEDRWDSERDWSTDLSYLAGRLRWADCPEFVLSLRSTDLRTRFLTGCLFRGIPLRRDIQEFLRDIPARVKAAKDYRRDGMIYVDDYGGLPEDLRGLTADFVQRTMHFPPGLSELRKGTLRARVMPPPAPQTGDWPKYRSQWFGKILDLYKDSPTKIIFLELPRGPIPLPPSALPETFPAWVHARSNTVALPSATFRFLERTELYVDGLHLNKAGRPLFTQTLAQQVMAIAGAH